MQSHQVRLLCCVFSDEKGFWNCDGHAAWIQIVTCCQASDTAAEHSRLQQSLHVRLLNPSAATIVQGELERWGSTEMYAHESRKGVPEK